jgi:hypothetical protein
MPCSHVLSSAYPLQASFVTTVRVRFGSVIVYVGGTAKCVISGTQLDPQCSSSHDEQLDRLFSY